MNLFSLFIAVAAAHAATNNADVEIKSARLDYARPANTFGYSAITANDGQDAAREVEVLVLLPPGAAIRNAEPCVSKGALVRCALGTLKPGDERRIFFLLLTREKEPQVTAIAVSDTPDPSPSNNVKRAATP